tara:strand:+ start:177 stop:353 length:177 start_codon:yes stop_codon:yes gene_type:complete
MKSSDRLRAETETIQQQMLEAKRKEPNIALKKAKALWKEFESIARRPTGSLADGREKS